MFEQILCSEVRGWNSNVDNIICCLGGVSVPGLETLCVTSQSQHSSPTLTILQTSTT